MSNKEVIGSIEWRDLTVEDASHISDFYAQVVGWEKEPVSMGDYDDFNMNNSEGTVAGICHARGGNSVIPPQWLMYVRVEDAELLLVDKPISLYVILVEQFWLFFLRYISFPVAKQALKVKRLVTPCESTSAMNLAVKKAEFAAKSPNCSNFYNLHNLPRVFKVE
jgi:hypothetical protein